MKVCGVSKSGYYNWRKHTKHNQEAKRNSDQEDFELILKAFNHKGYLKGYRSIHMVLLQWGILMNTKKIRRLMNLYNLRCPIRKVRPQRQIYKQSQQGRVVRDYVQREFKAYGPRRVLLTDISYLPYSRGRMAYLSTVKDAYTNEILSHTVSDSLALGFVLECMNQLNQNHGISLKKETIIHSDQGAHYTSIKFQTLVQHLSIVQSMSRRGNCWDNAPQESFFGHLKDNVKLDYIDTIQEVRAAIDQFIDYYNNDRPQWNLAKLTPSQYYQFYQTGIYPLPWIEEESRAIRVRVKELKVNL